VADRLDRFVANPDDLGWATICVTCVHKVPNEPTCAAFPYQIPPRFLEGTDHHRTPVDGDHGIVYAPKDGTT
jgi:hypothetical protein